MAAKPWAIKSLGSVLKRVSDPVIPVPDVLYREIGIRSHGKGIFHKEPVLGKSLGNKRVFKVHSDCFVVNIVFAWEQAVARTTAEETGMIASHRFPMYRPVDGLCDVDFLTYYFKAKKGKYLLELASPGGAGRNKTLGQTEFSRLAFPMPSGEEQAKIAKFLSTWDKSIAVTEKLITNSKAHKKALMQQLLAGRKRLPGYSQRWKSIRLGEIVRLNPQRASEPEDSRVTFIPMDAVSDDARLLRREARNYNDVDSGFTAFQDGDVIVAKITPCFENGKGAYVDGLLNGVGFGSTEFHVLRAKNGVSSRYVYHVTNSAEFRARGEANMQGSAGQKRVPTDFLRSYRLRMPGMIDEQHKIAEVLDAADAITDALTNMRNSFRTQRQALMQQLLTGKRRVKLDPVA